MNAEMVQIFRLFMQGFLMTKTDYQFEFFFKTAMEIMVYNNFFQAMFAINLDIYFKC